MKLLLGLVAGLMGLQQVAIADHATLERLAREMGTTGTNLYYGARQVLGPYPTYKQRYAFEHVSFFHNAAHRFERVVGAREESTSRDHASDVQYAFRQLDYDLYNARKTFPDLFYGVVFSELTSDGSELSEVASTSDIVTRDHPQFGKLEGYLRYAESLIPQIRNNLP